MNEAAKRVRRRHAAKSRLSQITGNPDNVVIIHYSCESFYDRPEGASPRITSIAVRNYGNGQTTSFSIHQIAERNKVSPSEINATYDDLEKTMLDEFYRYAEKHHSFVWVHWNMRDINYGFAALEHRYKVLGGQPIEIHEANRCDLARVLVGLYGVSYIGHPRLARLIEKNQISDIGFLSGAEEATAFENGEYVRLHQSTLRKVDIIANIIDRTVDGTLRTNARLKEIYGSYLAAGLQGFKEHPAFTVIGVVGALASIVALVLYLVT